MNETEFQLWYGNLPARVASETQNGIRSATGVTRQTILNWKNGVGGPSDNNAIRIAYYAKSHYLPAYLPDVIDVKGLQTDIEGNLWINARKKISDELTEERFVPYLE